MAFKLGDYNVICDKCGRKRYASQCRLNSDNLFVCSDTCWEPEHPQESVRGIPDYQGVPIARPDVKPAMGSTTLSAAATINALTVTLTSVTGIVDTDPIVIELDNGAAHVTFVDGAPAGYVVTLGSYLPYKAASGNTVYLPAISNETFLTATSVSATGL